MTSARPTPASATPDAGTERWLGRHWFVHVLFLLVMQWLFYARAVWIGGLSQDMRIFGSLFAGSIVLLVLCAAVLARVYRGLSERWLGSIRVVLPATLLPALGALVWHGGVMLVLSAMDGQPLRWRWLLVVDGTAMLVTWSCLFLTGVQGGRARRARERALRSEGIAHEARLEALRAQLNPHFLFNALNSVVVLIGRRPQQAAQLVRDLATLLRRVLESTQSEMATGGAERDFLARYVRCESVRFEERREVDVAVPPELRDRPIPPMLLQPLVENAMKHGAWRENLLRLELHAGEREGRVEIQLRNTGSLRASGANGCSGAGLRLVRQRLRATFPESASFNLAEQDGWVIARLSYDPKEPQRSV